VSVDVAAWESVLLHPVEALSADGIRVRAEASGLAPEKVEVFGWLLEIAAQAADVAEGMDLSSDGAMILRGGTSAQLRMPQGRERVSGDVDVLLRGSLQDAERLIEALNERFARCRPFLHFVELDRTQRPIGEFKAWRCFVPRQFGGARPEQEDDPGRAILFEVHAIGDEQPPPVAPLSGGVAFGLALTGDVEVAGLTTGALIGDKLDCLAAGLPIGIEEPKYDKHARHIYDVVQLKDAGPLTAPTLREAALTVGYFTRRDARVRDVEQHTPEETMLAAERFLITWGWPQPQIGSSDGRFAKAQGFEQYVPNDQRTSKLGWTLRALRTALIARAVRDALDDPDLAIHAYRTREAAVARIVKAPADQHAELAEQLVALRMPQLPARTRKSALVALLPKRPTHAQIERLALLAVLHDLTP
jgi:hypothetical protein